MHPSTTIRGRAPAGRRGRACQSSHRADRSASPARDSRAHERRLWIHPSEQRSSSLGAERTLPPGACTRRAWPREGYPRCGGEPCQRHSAPSAFCGAAAEMHARFRLSEPRPVYVSVMVSYSDLIRRRSFFLGCTASGFLMTSREGMPVKQPFSGTNFKIRCGEWRHVSSASPSQVPTSLWLMFVVADEDS
ncbi:hypothetical protein SEVIR_5G333201v4 [Setaria viridis]